MKGQLQRARHELGMVEAQLQRTDYHQLKAEIEAMRAEVAELEATGKTAGQRRERAIKKMASVEAKLANKAAVRERELKEAQQAVESAKKRAAASSQAYNQQESNVDALRLEIGEFEREVSEVVTAGIFNQLLDWVRRQDSLKRSFAK